MIIKNEPFLIEYNVRMGDPECQTILPKLKTNLLDIINACCTNELDKLKIEWLNKKSLCVVLCSKGYPEKYKKNIQIENIDKIKLSENEFIFHAGTSEIDNKIYSIGGRVLNFVCLSESFNDAKKNVMDNLGRLNWSNGFYRKDIGYKAID